MTKRENLTKNQFTRKLAIIFEGVIFACKQEITRTSGKHAIKTYDCSTLIGSYTFVNNLTSLQLTFEQVSTAGASCVWLLLFKLRTLASLIQACANVTSSLASSVV